MMVAALLATGVRAAGDGAAFANPGFETSGSDLVGWAFTCKHPEISEQMPAERLAKGEPVADISDQAHSGERAAHIFWDMPETDWGYSQWVLANSARLPVQPGQVFTITARMKGRSGFMCGQAFLEVLGGAEGQHPQLLASDMLVAKSYWQQFEAVVTIPDGCREIQVRIRGGHRTDLFLDDLAIAAGAPHHVKATKLLVQGFAGERIQERLNRGLVAIPTEGSRIYLSWRLLDSDAKDIAFNLYRASGGAAAARLNAEPLRRTTDYLDERPPSGESQYTVRAIVGGTEGADSEAVRVTPSSGGQAYLSIKLAGDYRPNKVAVGDLDGDGRYEYVIKQPNVSYDPWIGPPGHQYWKPSTDTYKLEAYTLDGKLMWRHDLGWSIETGVWFSPYIVYDFDGDGCAEVAMKAGEGDPRDPDGHVTSGPEWLLILDGKTGEERARAPWPPREGYAENDSLNRNLLNVAYLDGKTPCILAQRGTYYTIEIVAMEFDGTRLREVWRWIDREDGPRFSGQGAHALQAADIDGDGRDEVIIGAAAIDDNGVGMWSTGLHHPDHCSVGDLDPTRPGLEVQYGQEWGMKQNGVCQVDARTGEILWGLDEETVEIGVSLTAKLLPDYPGVQSRGWDQDLKKHWFHSAQGKLISSGPSEEQWHNAAYWDADLCRELWLDGRLRNLSAQQDRGPAIEGRLLAIADVLGDWREEIITVLDGELRIYTTTIPAADRRVCLMRDPIYRMGVCGESQGYLLLPGFRSLPGADR
jgi:hypothetical protein